MANIYNTHNCSAMLWLLNWHGPMCQFQHTCRASLIFFGFHMASTRTMPSILGTRGLSCGCRPMVLLWRWRVGLVGLKAWWRPTKSKVTTWKLRPRCGWKSGETWIKNWWTGAFVMSFFFQKHIFLGKDMVERWNMKNLHDNICLKSSRIELHHVNIKRSKRPLVQENSPDSQQI